MTGLLLRLFVNQQADDSAVHAAIGSLAGIVGIFCNALLFIGKLLLGLASGSVSIVADGLNNLTDASSSVITLVGFHMARRPADKHHPYGHARYEYISGFVVATLILVIGAELAKGSVEKIIHPSPVRLSAVTLALMLASILLKMWLAVFFRKLGKKINSTALLATSADSRNDVIATLAVLAGCMVNAFLHVNIDGWIGLLVALFILWSGIGIARETISPLLGRQADDELLERIEDMILSHEGVLGVHDLLVHDYGPGRYFASVHAELSADEDPCACHDIIDDIECDVLRELNVNLVIHYDPVATNDAELNEMRGILEGVINEIHPGLSMHDLRIYRGHSRPRLVFDLAVPYSMDHPQAELKQQIDEALRSMDKDYKTSIRFDGKE